MKPTFKKLEDPINAMTIKHKPKPPANTAAQKEKDIQREQIKQFVSGDYMLRSNMEKRYGLLWRKCSSVLQATIKGISEYEDKFFNFDAIWLLTKIKKAIPIIFVK